MEVVKPVFPFGKYRDKLIVDVCDISYLRWYYTTTKSPAVLKHILELDKSLGFYEDEIQPKVDINAKISISENFERFKKNPHAIITFKDNPNSDGIVNHFGIKFKFSSIVSCNYKGYIYYLPKLNDKGVHIKGKTFHIDSVATDTNGELIFAIKSFKKCV